MRASVNLDLDPGMADEDYLRECSTARCPSCGTEVVLDVLVVKDGVWRFP